MSQYINPNNESRITADGVYHCPYTFTGITAKWAAAGVSPAGTLTFAFDGDPAEGDNVLDLGAGQRIISIGSRAGYVDVEVTGLPGGGAVILYFR